MTEPPVRKGIETHRETAETICLFFIASLPHGFRGGFPVFCGGERRSASPAHSERSGVESRK